MRFSRWRVLLRPWCWLLGHSAEPCYGFGSRHLVYGTMCVLCLKVIRTGSVELPDWGERP